MNAEAKGRLYDKSLDKVLKHMKKTFPAVERMDEVAVLLQLRNLKAMFCDSDMDKSSDDGRVFEA